MRLTQIRDFLAVVECGSLRGAARKLGITQPTVSKSVRSLEAELQLQLLRRNARGVALTAPGRAFFGHVHVAYSELRKAQEEAAQFAGVGSGSVAFGIGPAGVILILPEAVARFRKQFPRAHMRIVEGISHVLLPSVRDETLDFVMGIRSSTPLDPALRFRPLYRSELVVCGRKGHPLRHARSLSELASADWLTTTTLGLPGGPLERLFQSAGLTAPPLVIECESYNTEVALLARTDMLGLMQRRTLQGPMAREFIQEIPIANTMPSVTAGIFTRADGPLTRVAAAMAKAAMTVARGLARRT
jgi:LysR family transcriptional regulator, regulator of abg operon